jgi:hypothetical protein
VFLTCHIGFQTGNNGNSDDEYDYDYDYDYVKELVIESERTEKFYFGYRLGLLQCNKGHVNVNRLQIDYLKEMI